MLDYMDRRSHEAGFQCILFVYLIPITSVGRLVERKMGRYAPMAKLEERCRLKIYWALPVSVRIRVGAPRVDVYAIVSAPKKSKEVGFCS